jgi:hypothetical protein
MVSNTNNVETKIDDETSDALGVGAGAASLAGYEYQIDVSVWLALDLILVSQLTDSLVLEPASQEDLEATLTEFEPSRSVCRIPIAGYSLLVQVKRRGGDAWTPTTFGTLLKHGSEKRPSAANRLKDNNIRYVLVTSAGVNGEAKNIAQRKVGVWPRPTAMPQAIATTVDYDISGRVAIIANEDDERLRGDIDRLLVGGCGVPNKHLDACRTKLREEARTRILGAGAGSWRREELEGVIRTYGGYLASVPELEGYVHPENWKDLRRAMEEKSAAIIIGQSGTGKTLATKMLYEELRKNTPGLTRVPITLGPSQLRDDKTPPPILYDIEDPWGRFNFDPNSRPWNDQLSSFFANATPDRMIIATSRLDVAKASGAFESVNHWAVGLEAENYGQAKRETLYRSRIDGLPRDLQLLASKAERLVLDKLATPFEIQKFFDAMRTQERDASSNLNDIVSEAIDRAHQDSIEKTVIEQIHGRDDMQAAAIVWALLASNGKATRTVIREIEDGLADKDSKMTKGVSPLVDFFVSARNLRQSDGGIISYYHPRVEAGILGALRLEVNRQPVRQTLLLLIDFLVSDLGPGAEWGAGTAARLFARAGSEFGLRLQHATRAKIDAWLQAGLAEGGKEFQAHLILAAQAGSEACNVAEVARFLLSRPDNSFYGIESWAPQKKSDNWFSARKQDPSTKPVIEMFIRSVLPHGGADYPKSFANELDHLSPDLTDAFLDAAKTAVHFGYMSSDDAIAFGALRDIDGFEAVVDSAFDLLTRTEEAKQQDAQTDLDIVNEVYSEEYAAFLSSNDDGYTAMEFLRAYVEHVRGRIGWKRIAQHRHADRFRSYWFRALAAEAKTSSIENDEYAAAFEAGFGTIDEDHLWRAQPRVWDPQIILSLETRIREGSPDVEIESAALDFLLEHVPGAFPTIVQALAAQDATSRLVEISCTLFRLLRSYSDDSTDRIAAIEAAVEQMPPTYGEIYRAEKALRKKEIPVLSVESQSVLSNIFEPKVQVRELRLKLSRHILLPVEDDVHWVLRNSDDSATAVLAVKTAIRLEMTDEVNAALNHRFAHVVACALTAVATSVSTPIPEALLAFANHRASPVRQALANILKLKPNPAHIEILIKLAGDEWSPNEMFYGNDDGYHPIARAAIDALMDLGPTDSQDVEDLIAIAVRTKDPVLRSSVFDGLAKISLAMQLKLFDLAVNRGRQRVRSSAALALLNAAELIDQTVVDKISPDLIANRIVSVASVLALLLGLRGSAPNLMDTAKELATNSKRKVLLLLVIWQLKDRDQQVAKDIANMLPPNHKAVAWALGGSLSDVEDATLADLGGPAACSEVLEYMNIKTH